MTDIISGYLSLCIITHEGWKQTISGMITKAAGIPEGGYSMNAIKRIGRLFRGKRERYDYKEVERISAGRDKLCHLLNEQCGLDRHTTSLKVDPIVGQMYYNPGPPVFKRL